ncbi:IclR family transcriptional regulator [Salinibacterium sp. TMP30]|uniref:IclR family transcriptional regulator n=1 Tax=Salinibacterium sp. TMP30 TaxID=3138237 RepID=UPI0031390E28
MGDEKRSEPVKSAGRALTLVEYVAAEGPKNFTEILEALNIPRSSAHSLLQTLTDAGWLEHEPRSKQYSLGLRAWQVGQRYRGHSDLADVAKGAMDRLVRAVGETVQIARLNGLENIYIAISESDKQMRLASSVGGRLPAHATGVGKVLLSMLDPVAAEQLLRPASLSSFTDRTITDADELLSSLESIRAQGFAMDDEEYVSGCRCVAVPLTSSSEGGMLTAISVTMPTSRTDQNWPESMLQPLRLAANEIRSTLGIPKV